ncbi:hypothetical protein GCG54_00000413 [Colletotrichum gloeosporioides]|uniref:Metalloprotease n=1 Tax=Colletotrichum gloeosporioides TaxID=474922 RepID=A0A8H4CUL7_COLGL|nr:uncharacterized protein GCG54_00000413 [Colletotrichum gloeosporioides]KAF3810368.1 hypothetical protein GCG54_00000413 [Colletotrichum gloeosporioides]
MKITSLGLLACLVGLSLAVPHMPRDVDPENPSASDPKTPPSSLKDPPRPQSVGQNPFAGKSVTVPGSCGNLWNPSETCLRDLEAQNENVGTYAGDLKFEDNSCDDGQKLALEIAAWDALTLANFGGKNPQSAKEIATWRAYIGPDFSSQQGRIVDNLRRIQDHRPKKKFDIIASCKDTKGWCKAITGGSVGGYAWTEKGWFGYTFQHITLCPIYFGLDSLEGKFEMIEEALARGDTTYAEIADWQKNKGQYFLHEMMHLDAVGQPHISDQYLSSSENIGPKAYGPAGVYTLAQKDLKRGGGATRASLNADSYAWLANSLYFYDATGYFPRPSEGTKGAEADNIYFVDLGEFEGEAKDAEIEKRFKAEVDSFSSPPPTPTDSCKSDSDCSSPLCAGGGAVYSCVEGSCQCGSPKPPPLSSPSPSPPINTPPPGTKCFEDVSESDCTSKYECPDEKKVGCVKNGLAEITWCTCF